MKAAIYVICFFVLVAIQVAAKNAGYILGAISMVLLWVVMMTLVPSALCKLWDKFKNKSE